MLHQKLFTIILQVCDKYKLTNQYALIKQQMLHGKFLYNNHHGNLVTGVVKSN